MPNITNFRKISPAQILVLMSALYLEKTSPNKNEGIKATRTNWNIENKENEPPFSNMDEEEEEEEGKQRSRTRRESQRKDVNAREKLIQKVTSQDNRNCLNILKQLSAKMRQCSET